MNISINRLSMFRKILGVNCHASKTEIKKAFKRQAVVRHPDRWDKSKDTKHNFYLKWYNLVNAYQTLMKYESPAQRNRYRGYIRHAYTGKFALVRYEPDNQD